MFIVWLDLCCLRFLRPLDWFGYFSAACLPRLVVSFWSVRATFSFLYICSELVHQSMFFHYTFLSLPCCGFCGRIAVSSTRHRFVLSPPSWLTKPGRVICIFPLSLFVRDGMSCYVMLGCVVLCYVMLYGVMSCYVM